MFTAPLLRARFIVPAITLILLLLTVGIPYLSRHDRASSRNILLTLAALTIAALVIRSIRLSRRNESTGRPAVELLLHMSPVVLLSVVFPIVSSRIGRAEIGDAPLSAVLLAASLTVPWLSQAACLPLYRALGALISQRDPEAVLKRFCEAWPAAFAKTAPMILVFALPVQLITSWSFTAMGAYLGLCLLNLAFAQSLIPANIGRQRKSWAIAWTGYAAALLLFPTLWFLPPVIGLLTQVVPMRSTLMQMRRPDRLETSDVAKDVLRGLLLGAVLWSDKFFFFLKSDGQFQVSLVFAAMLPAVVAYNYYFVRIAPNFDDAVDGVRVAMEREPYRELTKRSGALVNTIEAAIYKTGFIGAFLALALTAAFSLAKPEWINLVTLVAVASWLFMMTTILCYKLDYVGQHLQAQLLSGAHLLLTALVFLTVAAGPALYGWLIVGEGFVFAAALTTCLKHWRSAEYALFWRHAVSW